MPPADNLPVGKKQEPTLPPGDKPNKSLTLGDNLPTIAP